MVQPAEGEQSFAGGLRDFIETLWPGRNSAVMAARPQACGGTRRAVSRVMPPSAAVGLPACLARTAQRQGPRKGAPGWLGVAKRGERKIRSAPRWRARRRPEGPCAATERRAQGAPARRARRKGRSAEVAGRSGQCSPTWCRRAARGSAPSSRGPARRRASSGHKRGGTPRATSPLPRGRAAHAARGSGSRAGSLNSQRRGRAPRLGACRDLSRIAAASRVRTPCPPSPTT